MLKSTLLLSFALIPGYLFAQPQPSEVIDVKHYSFQIEVNDSTDRITCVADISAVVKNSAAEIELDVIGKKTDGKGMVVSQVTIGNTPLKFSQQNDKLKISLSRPFTNGDNVTLNIGIVEFRQTDSLFLKT